MTQVQNAFVTEYLPDANGDAVKVYLYGLFLCENSTEEISVDDFAKAVYMETETVKDCFKFWEEYGIVSVISTDPFTVKYLSVSKTSKPRKFKPEKYTEFNKSVQALLSERMITTAEYSAYFSLMEDYAVKPEAMLMIVKYCVDLKGKNVGYKYIITVMRDFISRGVNTVEAIENELNDYLYKTGEIEQILLTLGLKRKADVDDLKYFNKWQRELQFDLKAILFSSKKAKVKSMERLDALMLELYNNKSFSQKEIESYFNERNEIIETAKLVARELGTYVEVVTPYVENYVTPWKNKGFDRDALIFIANYCFKKKCKSFDEMNETVENLYSNGYVTLESIIGYTKSIGIADEFIKKLLDASYCDRRPNRWDRENLSQWRDWGFSDEMLLEAAKVSQGKNNPMAYMNIVLSNWKSQGVFTPDKIPSKPTERSGEKKADLFGNERKYTREDFDAIINNLEDVDL